MNRRQNAWIGKETSGLRKSQRRPARKPRTQMPASQRRRSNVRRSILIGKTRTAYQSARSSSADVALRPCRSCIRDSTGPRVFTWVRRYPMAMLPFCGYHMGDYFRHWILMQRSLSETPRVFHVNWFRKDKDGNFMWPGFSENMRVLKWVVDRAHGRSLGQETPIGWMPRYEDIEWQGLDFSKDKFDELQAFGRDDWRQEVLGHEELFLDLHDRLPPEMIYERELLICRL